jgi:hypothetical protein
MSIEILEIGWWGMASVAVLFYPLYTVFNEISAQIVATLYTDLITDYLKFSLNSGYWCDGCYVICKYFPFLNFLTYLSNTHKLKIVLEFL